MGLKISDKTIWLVSNGKEISYNAERRVKNLIDRIANKKISRKIVNQVSNCLEGILTRNYRNLGYKNKEVIESFYQKFPGFSKVYKENKKNIDNLVKKLSKNENLLYGLAAIKKHRNETFGHAMRTSPLIIAFYFYLKNNGENLKFKIKNGVEGTCYHCFGKPTIRTEILYKKGGLNPVEKDIVKEHVIYGCAVIKNWISKKSIPYVMVLQHHRNEDGSGYPEKIKIKKLHKATKILKVIDVYDALTNPRVYRAGKACSHKTALRFIETFSIKNYEERANYIRRYSKEDRELKKLIEGQENRVLFDRHITQKFINYIEELRS